MPFRDSKLTYLLQDSLGKDNKTLMIVQVNPMMGSRGETMCSLNFATRVRSVELGKAKAHSSVDMEEISRMKAAVRYRQQLCLCQHAPLPSLLMNAVSVFRLLCCRGHGTCSWFVARTRQPLNSWR